MTTQTILLAGGAGYIGSYVNLLLNRKGFQTIVLDNLCRGDRNNVKEGLFIEGDIGNTEDVERVFGSHSVDAVMHFAAHLAVGESVTDPQKYYNNNVVNTLHLLNAMLRHKIPCFIFSSSAAVYGMPQSVPIPETHPCAPINPYGTTKRIIERCLADYHKAYGLSYASLRYFNAAGADPSGTLSYHTLQTTNLIPIALNNLLAGRETTVFGTDYPTKDGTCIRDYIHIHDLATAHILALEKALQERGADVYNLGNECGHSVSEVLSAVEKVVGQPLSLVYGPRREGDPPLLLANANKARKKLNWHSEYPEVETMIGHLWTSLASQRTVV